MTRHAHVWLVDVLHFGRVLHTRAFVRKSDAEKYKSSQEQKTGLKHAMALYAATVELIAE